jgi:CheY-like chemotaxis protein
MFAMIVDGQKGRGRPPVPKPGQRRFMRLPVSVDVTGTALQFPDRNLRGTVRDIGRGGLMAEFPVELVPGSLIQLSLNAPSGPVQDTGRVIWSARMAQFVRHGVAFPEVKPRGYADAISATEDLRSAEIQAPPDPALDPSTRGQAILIVDDDVQLLEVASFILEIAGHRPLVARSGIEALSYLRRWPSQVTMVLLNLHLPGENTAEVYDRLRLLHPEVPVLLTSGEPEESALAHFQRPGLAGFLYKPVGIPAWIPRIEAALAEYTGTEPSGTTSARR